MDGFSELDSFDLMLFFKKVHFSEFVIELLDFIIFWTQLQLSFSDLLIELPAPILLDRQSLNLRLQIMNPDFKLIFLSHKAIII